MINFEIYIYLFTALFGAIIGSFLNVVILRLPDEDASIVFPASHCPKCKSPISWYENIPILSYLYLGGKCSSCKTKISLQYPVVEFLSSFLALAIVFRFGLSLTSAIYFVFSSALLVIIWIDIHHQIIPDLISLPGIILGFLFSFIIPIVSWQDSLIGILVGGGILLIISELYYFIRKRAGMGGGDIKLLAMLGAFLGWKSLPFIILFSSISGLIIGLSIIFINKSGTDTRIPFGPYLSVAGLLYLLFFEQINIFYYWYLTLGIPS